MSKVKYLRTESELLEELHHLFFATNIFDLLNKEIFEDVNEKDRFEVANELLSSINLIGGESKRIDNLRINKESNKISYDNIKIEGNRSFYDKKFTSTSNNIYLIGFNHD